MTFDGVFPIVERADDFLRGGKIREEKRRVKSAAVNCRLRESPGTRDCLII